MRRRLAVTLLPLLIACTACHSPAHQATASGPPATGVGNVITRAEIDASDAHNVYDLVARLRGGFLKDRGRVSIKMNVHNRAVVFMNDQEYGILETMRNIPVGRIAEVRYYPGIEAVAKYGSQYGGGVVLLISRVN